jgi:hypothetical protein
MRISIINYFALGRLQFVSFAMTTIKSLVLALLLICLLLPPMAASGQRRLLPATFQTYSTGGGAGTPLQPSTGLHLDGNSVDRRPGTNPTPYNPGEPSLNWAWVRWEPKKMPLKVWISPGLALPDLPFEELQKVRPDQVYEILTSPIDTTINPSGDPFFDLSTANAWTPETNDQVQAGIMQWKPLENEGLFSFTFTNDPREAQIMVFFVDSFRDSSSPGGIMVGGNTCAQIYPLAQALSVKIRQKPVIIELSTMVNETPEKMIGATAHEFGHALGIKAHSPYREDIMNENRVATRLSAADKATIRKLYRTKPAYVM